jgi:transporter family-2 protein
MEKMSPVFTGLAIVLGLGAGCLMAMQPAVNGRLSEFCSHKLQASLISFGVGFLALLALGTFLRIGLPDTRQLSQVPWWGWTGGLIGAYMVTVSLWVAPSLGATRWIALVLAGQVTLSLALDHFGLLGFAEHAFTVKRLLGVAVLAAGVWIVMEN